MTREEKLAEASAYALGLLEGVERRNFEASMAADPELKKMTAQFNQKISALDDPTRPVTVPQSLLARLETEFQAKPSMPAAHLTPAKTHSAREASRKVGRFTLVLLIGAAAGATIALSLGYLVEMLD